MDLVLLLLVLWFFLTSIYIICWWIGNVHKKYLDFLDETIPISSRILTILGAIYFILGIIVLFLPILFQINITLSPGLSVAAFGIATFSYSMAQLQNFKSKTDMKEIKNQLKGISEKLEKITR